MERAQEPFLTPELLLDNYQKEKTAIQRQVHSLEEEIKIYFDKQKKAKQKRKEFECFINALFDMKSKDVNSIDEEFIRKIIDFVQISKNREVIIHFKFDITKQVEMLGGFGYE